MLSCISKPVPEPRRRSIDEEQRQREVSFRNLRYMRLTRPKSGREDEELERPYRKLSTPLGENRRDTSR